MKLLVTSALPYANGDLHLGHLAGCYLPADIYVRYQRLAGRDVIHICGTDEHGVQMVIKAQEEQRSPQAIVDQYHTSIKRSLAQIGIIHDNFSRTTRPLHYQTAQQFFTRIYEQGYITPQDVTQFYCTTCERFLSDRYVEGTCPHCSSAGARGDQCESCGHWLEPTQLIDPRCKTCGGVPVRRDTRHWFFALDRLQPRLEDWLATKTGWKENVRRFCRGWFQEGLVPRAITRDLDWGVPVPLPEAQGKVLYVWFDAPIGYISSTREWAERIGTPDRWQDYWCDPETRLVHFLGKDNIVFHAIVWPAMLMVHGGYVLPSEIPANEFLNIEGQKLSTSRNWAVWLPEALAEFEPDPIRYALAANLPETRDVDFTWRDFQARNNNELADILGNFINRVLLFITKYRARRVPGTADYREPDQAFLAEVARTADTVAAAIEGFEIKNGIKEIIALGIAANRYFDYQQPWRTRTEDPPRCDRTLSACVRAISALEILIRPYLPFTADRVRNMLDLPERRWSDARTPLLPAAVGPTEVLFGKVEDEKIARQVARLGTAPAPPTGVSAEKGAIVELSFDEFKKMELKVAKVLEATRVENTAKLLKLRVDIGGEERTIVAGIAEVYAPEDLVGKQIVLVANLAPATIRGVTSHGMLLAAVAGSTISVLVPDKAVPPGSPVS